MNLLFDTSVWVEHLRHGALDAVVRVIRGRFMLRLDAVVASELLAGCRSKKERRIVAGLVTPHTRARKLLVPTASDFERAATALSRLRERGRTVSGSKSALLDALIVSLAFREGALVVTRNLSDFSPLATVVGARVDSFDAFAKRIFE